MRRIPNKVKNAYERGIGQRPTYEFCSVMNQKAFNRVFMHPTKLNMSNRDKYAQQRLDCVQHIPILPIKQLHRDSIDFSIDFPLAPMTNLLTVNSLNLHIEVETFHSIHTSLQKYKDTLFPPNYNMHITNAKSTHLFTWLINIMSTMNSD